MLIISEENEKLKGTKYRLPQKIVDRYKDVILNYPGQTDKTGYKKAKNVLAKGGVVSMEWLKNMKHFFTKHFQESDIEFILGGGYLVKTYVDSQLDRLTSSYGRAQHTNDPTKVRKDASNLGGNRGEHASQSLSVVKSLMADIIPKFESKQNNKILIVTEDQIKEVFRYLY